MCGREVEVHNSESTSARPMDLCLCAAMTTKAEEAPSGRVRSTLA